MKKIKLFSLILLTSLLMSLSAPAAFALEEPSIPAKAAVLVDLNSGKPLYALNMDEQRSPASLTKIMTVLLALEAVDSGKCSMDTLIMAQSDCRSGMDESSSTSGIQPGTELTMRELLYCAMLQSANEACNIIGTYLGGSIEGFVGMMNQRAAELGCTNTNFVTTNGLTAEGHYSSAYDLYKITAEAIKHPDFLKIANTLSYLPTTELVNGGQTMNNSNALLTPSGVYGDDYVYEYASGVKTGYTRAAGYCLVSTAEKDGIHVLAVVLGCDGLLNAGLDEYRNFESTIALYDWAFENFAYQDVLKAGDTVTKADVALAKDDVQAILKPAGNVRLLLPKDVSADRITTSVSLQQDKLVAPLEEGAVLGEVKVFVDGELYDSAQLVNSVKVELSRIQLLKQKLVAIFTNGWVIALLIVIAVFGAIYLALVLRYRSLRKKHLRARRMAQERRRQEQEKLYREQEFTQSYDEAQGFRDIEMHPEEEYNSEEETFLSDDEE